MRPRSMSVFPGLARTACAGALLGVLATAAHAAPCRVQDRDPGAGAPRAGAPPAAAARRAFPTPPAAPRAAATVTAAAPSAPGRAAAPAPARALAAPASGEAPKEERGGEARPARPVEAPARAGLLGIGPE
uniref:Uncharacterized protein n=1 Tax=Eiseniibacteriota bacterium TaxID=2212470 RepID=A0A832I543_UNCEI